MVKNSTVLIVGLLIVGGISLCMGEEMLSTTIVGGLIGFLAKDPVVLEEIIGDDDGSVQ